MKPPRYPSLWEAIVNAVVYQQVSIHAAGAILRRVIERYAAPLETNGVRLYPFPLAAHAARCRPDRAARPGPLGQQDQLAQSGRAPRSKRASSNESALEPLPTPELIEALVAHKGIGPWTGAVVALRGFGRLDIFPMNDSGAEADCASSPAIPTTRAEPIIEALRPQQGMLYYHLLLGRLHATGEVTLQ